MRLFFGKFGKNTKVFALFAFVCLIGVILSFTNAVKYKNEKKLDVRATVTNIEEYVDSDEHSNEWHYKIYVDYHCLGKTYKNIYYTDEPGSTDYSVGDKINIEVYYNQPEKVAEDTSFTSLVFSGVLAVLLVVTVISAKKDMKIQAADNSANDGKTEN